MYWWASWPPYPNPPFGSEPSTFTAPFLHLTLASSIELDPPDPRSVWRTNKDWAWKSARMSTGGLTGTVPSQVAIHYYNMYIYILYIDMYITKTECLLEVLEGSKALALGFNMTVLRKLHIPTSPPLYTCTYKLSSFLLSSWKFNGLFLVKCKYFIMASHISHQS